MVWKNPFLIRYAEKIDTDANFFQLFSAETLSSVDESSFGLIQYIESTPGAGKTTLFKALQSSVLALLNDQNETTSDFYKKAMQYRIIDSDRVKLLSCIVSCAKNYDLIDSTFQNGRRQQIFFALLNVRISILLLKSIRNIFRFENLSELSDITFADYPDEFVILDKPINNGYELYLWAQSEERKICHYLDDLSDEKTNFTFVYNDLFLLKLFEPHNIFYKGENFLNYTLIILDDVHKLTSCQRELVIKTLYTMRPNLGIWIGERIEALSDTEIVTNDAIENREYRSIRLEDFYWKMKQGFNKVLMAIADRRVRMYDSNQIKNFSNCLDNKPDYKMFNDKLEFFLDETAKKISSNEQFGVKYLDVLETIINDSSCNTYTKALKIAVLLIKYNRDCASGQVYLLPPEYTIDEYQSFFEYKDNIAVANYYLCEKLEMPYYYGEEKIIEISSHNIEQFLAFAGEIFSNSISKTIIGNRQTKITLNPNEQHKAIKKIAAARFEEITRRFSCGEKIKNLLSNLCQRSTQTRNEWKNSYSGGTVTGVGILKHYLDQIKYNDKYCELLHVLSAAISANYFEKRHITQGGYDWVVFYYNRWVCVHYNLPLNYGGWFKSSLDELDAFLSKKIKKDVPKTEILEVIDYGS